MAAPCCSEDRDLAFPQPPHLAGPSVPPAWGCGEQAAAFSIIFPEQVLGRPSSSSPDSSAPRLPLLGRDRKALEAGSTLAVLSPAPVPPVTFLLPALQGRGVPSPRIPPLAPGAGPAQPPTDLPAHRCSQLTGCSPELLSQRQFSAPAPFLRQESFCILLRPSRRLTSFLSNLVTPSLSFPWLGNKRNAAAPATVGEQSPSPAAGW